MSGGLSEVRERGGVGSEVNVSPSVDGTVGEKTVGDS
jgi:hypothetical protein